MLAGSPATEAASGDPMADHGDAVSHEQILAGPNWRRVIRRLRNDKAAVFGVCFLVVVVIVAIFASQIAPYSPTQTDFDNISSGPSQAHWLGTDTLGRDVLSRLMYGARVSMRVCVLVVVFSAVPGLIIGMFAGYRRGSPDAVIMRLSDAFQSIPGLVLILAIAGTLGPGLNSATVALSIVFTPAFVRLVRARTLVVREETFVEASRSIGTSTPRILFKRVMPNVVSPVIVQATIVAGGAILAEAALSFLGYGQVPPNPSWGSMLSNAYDSIYQGSWLSVPPGVLIALTVLAFNFLGDGLRDAMGLDSTRAIRSGDRRAVRRAGRGMTVVERQCVPEATPTSAVGDDVLRVEQLTVQTGSTDRGSVSLIDGVSLSVRKGQVTGLVGESGSGKTVTSLAIMRLLPSPGARITSGSVWFDGKDLLGFSRQKMQQVRGKDIAMIFQDPMSSFNPVFTIGNQIAEAVRLHENISRRLAWRRAVDALGRVGIPQAERRAHDYPHEFSGGMLQRAMIAMALINEPKVLIADEPTTALDVTIQKQIVELLGKLREEMGMSMLFVTHDMGVVAEICDRVTVMYAGEVVEQATLSRLFAHPQHPYTEALLASIPRVDRFDNELVTIRGRVPTPDSRPSGCRFEPRCSKALPECARTRVPLVLNDGGESRCILTAQSLRFDQ